MLVRVSNLFTITGYVTRSISYLASWWVPTDGSGLAKYPSSDQLISCGLKEEVF